MLNPYLVEQSKTLTVELAELHQLGYAGDDLARATEVLAYRAFSRLGTQSAPAGQDDGTVDFGELDPPGD